MSVVFWALENRKIVYNAKYDIWWMIKEVYAILYPEQAIANEPEMMDNKEQEQLEQQQARLKQKRIKAA